MSERPIRVAVVGVGDFGRSHVRVLRDLEGAEMAGLLDTDSQRAARVAAEFGVPVLDSIEALAARADAAVLAVPTVEHARLGCALLERGLDVLVEKPMAVSLAEADALISAAARNQRILQVGHLERFNPAIAAVRRVIARPLFFEVHRLG